MSEIYLAGGCFWGLEEYFSRIKGVTKTTVGYANGITEATNYQQVHTTDHAETVHVTYDEAVISLTDILRYYFPMMKRQFLLRIFCVTTFALLILSQLTNRVTMLDDSIARVFTTAWIQTFRSLIELLQAKRESLALSWPWKLSRFVTTFLPRITTRTISRKILVVTAILM